MTVYRKLAASSVAAIRKALYRRLMRLQNNALEEAKQFNLVEKMKDFRVSLRNSLLIATPRKAKSFSTAKLNCSVC